MKTITEMRQKLAEKAAADEGFRKSLISDPKTVVAKEYGIQIPEGVRIAVHEDSATTANLVLSPNPQLSDKDLEGAVGGFTDVQDPYGNKRSDDHLPPGRYSF